MLRRLTLISFFFIPALLVQQALAVRPTVIYGDDDRLDYYQADEASKKLSESTVALIRASNLENQGLWTQIKTVSYGQSMGLCTSEPFFSQETAAFCSGFLVTPDLIVTAGHCVRSQANCEATKFVFGFRVDSEGTLPRQVLTQEVYSCKQLIHSVANPAGEDFAVARLDRPVTSVPPLDLRRQGRIEAGASLSVMGHPAGLPLKIAGGAYVRSVQTEHLVANLDTYGGNSGSAVFNSVTGLIEGILVRGEMDFTFKDGCRISNHCDNQTCRGEDVTLIERVLPFLD